MSSETSTERAAPAASSTFRPSHFYLLLSMCGAIAAVLMARHTHPAALLLISAAVIAAGLAAYALHTALIGFWTRTNEPAPLSDTARESLTQDKAHVLRSIKELEFDHAMRKISDSDYAELSARLRGRALEIMADLDLRPPAPAEVAPPLDAQAAGLAAGVCAACGTPNDGDARFCKHCGARLGA